MSEPFICVQFVARLGKVSCLGRLVAEQSDACPRRNALVRARVRARRARPEKARGGKRFCEELFGTTRCQATSGNHACMHTYCYLFFKLLLLFAVQYTTYIHTYIRFMYSWAFCVLCPITINFLRLWDAAVVCGRHYSFWRTKWSFQKKKIVCCGSFDCFSRFFLQPSGRPRVASKVSITTTSYLCFV